MIKENTFPKVSSNIDRPSNPKLKDIAKSRSCTQCLTKCQAKSCASLGNFRPSYGYGWQRRTPEWAASLSTPLPSKPNVQNSANKSSIYPHNPLFAYTSYATAVHSSTKLIPKPVIAMKNVELVHVEPRIKFDSAEVDKLIIHEELQIAIVDLELLSKLRDLIIDWVQEGFQDFFRKLNDHFLLLSGKKYPGQDLSFREGIQGDKVLPGLVLVLAQLPVFVPRITEEIASSFSGGGSRGYEHGPAFSPVEIYLINC